jgi:hypothetical protein
MANIGDVASATARSRGGAPGACAAPDGARPGIDQPVGPPCRAGGPGIDESDWA